MADQPSPDNRNFGLTLTGAGVILMVLGCALFFNPSILALGNIFLVVGVSLLLGTSTLATFVSEPSNRKGSGISLAGFVLVLYRWGLLGLLLEGYGFFTLFGDLTPAALEVFRQIPFLGQWAPQPPAPPVEQPQSLAAQFADQFLTAIGKPQRLPMPGEEEGGGANTALAAELTKQFGMAALASARTVWSQAGPAWEGLRPLRNRGGVIPRRPSECKDRCPSAPVVTAGGWKVVTEES